MYRALIPRYEKQGEWFRVTWIVLGMADDMADARRKYGGRPVLEAFTL